MDPKFLGGAGRKKAGRDAPPGEEAVIPWAACGVTTEQGGEKQPPSACAVLYLPVPSVQAGDQLLLAPGRGKRKGFCLVGFDLFIPKPLPVFPSSPLEEWLFCVLQPQPGPAEVRRQSWQGTSSALFFLGLWLKTSLCPLSPTAPLPQVREGRLRQVQLQALLHPPDGLRV